jgi:indole-3-glycerol phosphate synthase
VHDREELDRALLLETSLIGINNRNLKTLVTDLAVSEELAPLVPPDRFLIAESGIRTTEDLRRLAAIGSSCYLVGESLMRQDDVTVAVRALLGDRAEAHSGDHGHAPSGDHPHAPSGDHAHAPSGDPAHARPSDRAAS